MKNKAAFVYSEDLLHYKFNQDHPFNQKRLILTIDLLTSIGALAPHEIIEPKHAHVDDIKLFHDEKYIEAVQKAGKQLITPEQAENFGLGTEDTPIFPDMHETSSLVVGGTLTATKLVIEQDFQHAVHLGGGLHHGFQRKASGFCIYNDCAVAIKYMREKYNLRVLYIDTDAHHGDGVQWAFYDDPNVCTFSIHETGRYLFPGTGNIYERGHGAGLGYTFNIPLDAFTEDESWLYAFRRSMNEIVEYFQPDIIISQNGADAHFYDPLTHLSTTINIYREIPKLTHELAHKYCNGKWIAVGGGGYDIWRVVPRAWSYIWLVMTDQLDKGAGMLPAEWIEKWQKEAPVELPHTWEDPDNLYPPIPRKKAIEEKNRITVEKALQFIHARKT